MAKKRKQSSKKKREEKRKISSAIVVCLLGFFWLILRTRQYNFLGLALPLWYVALGLSAIVAAFAVWFFHKKLPADTSKDVKLDIGLALLVLFFVFVMMQTFLTHMNHIFDPYEPERYVVVIEDEDYDSGGRKSPGYMEFRVTINGEGKTIVVPWRHAYQFQEGDLYVVEYHKGAFNEPYYIGVGAP